MKSRKALLAAAASTIVLTLGVTACSSDAEPYARTPGAVSAEAPATDDAAGDATQAAFFQAITAAQADVRTSHVSMQVAAGDQTISADGDIEIGDTPADTAMTMTMDLGAAGVGSLSMILVDNAFYVNLGQQTDNKFGRIDLDDASGAVAQRLATITDQLDPSQQLEGFQKSLTSLQESGEPITIDGVEAQPYELTLDTSKIPSFADVSGAAAASIPDTLTYTMYIGPDDLLRRVTADVAGTSITADYTRWGDPVDVSAPAPDQISEAASTRLSQS